MSPEEPPPRPKETPLDGYLPVGADAEEDEAERDADRPRREGRTGRRDRAEAPREVPEPPAHPFLQGVYTFPWYSSSLGAWLVLAGGFLALGLVALAMLSLGGQLT